MSKRSEHAHDIFLSYAEADRAWVEGYLLDALKAAGVRAHSEEAFRLGVPRLLEFEEAVQGSERTLLVLTPAYLADEWSTSGEQLSSHASVAERRDRQVAPALDRYRARYRVPPSTFPHTVAPNRACTFPRTRLSISLSPM